MLDRTDPPVQPPGRFPRDELAEEEQEALRRQRAVEELNDWIDKAAD